MKRLTAVVIALLLFVSVMLPAQATTSCDCGKTPLVVVGGMNGNPLIIDKGTPNERQIWAPPIDAGQVALTAARGIGAGLINRDWNALGDAIVPLANELLEPAACDADGNSKYNIYTETYPESMVHYPAQASGGYSEGGLIHTACDKLGTDHTYFFNYDWRLDPLENVKDLRALVNKAKAETGHAKVDFAVCSMGANQALAYLAVYGHDDIENCVFLSSVFGGSLVASELFNKQVVLDNVAVQNYLRQSVNSPQAAATAVDLLLQVLDATGALDALLNFTQDGLNELLDRAFREVLVDNFCTMPGVWALIREDVFESARDDLLDPVKHAVLLERINDFHFTVRRQRETLIRDAMNDGVIVTFTSHYNRSSIPVFPSAPYQGDGLVEVPGTSAGATSAVIGRQFPEGYTQAVDFGGINYISPDNAIDASTSMFPDLVWFFRDVPHVACPYGSEYNEFVFKLLEAKTQPTVTTLEGYAQFMATDDGGYTLYALDESTVVPAKEQPADATEDEEITASEPAQRDDPTDEETAVTQEGEDDAQLDASDEKQVPNPKTGAGYPLLPLATLATAGLLLFFGVLSTKRTPTRQKRESD